MSTGRAAILAAVIALAVATTAWILSGSALPPPPTDDSSMDEPAPAAAPTRIDAEIPTPAMRSDELSIPDLAIRGSVTLRGTPVDARVVRLLGTLPNGEHLVAHATTDAGGRFRFEVRPGDYEVAASRDRRSQPHDMRTLDENLRVTDPTFVRITDQSVDCELQLPPGRVEVTVRDADTGAGIPHAWVYSDIQHGWSIWSESTDASGRAVFDEVELGDLGFRATAAMHQDLGPLIARLTATAPVQFLEFALGPAGELTVVCVESYREDSHPESLPRLSPMMLQDIAVSNVDTGETAPAPQMRSATLGKLGVVPLVHAGLPPGEYRVSLHDDVDAVARSVHMHPVGRDPSDATVSVVAGERNVIKFAVDVRAHVRLTGRDRDGLDRTSRATLIAMDGPYAGMTVLPEEGHEETTHLGAHFHGALVPGTYEVSFQRDAGRTWARRFVVERDDLDLTFDLPW
ncbi:MAG: carboxypeptidase regulatory-like domain-containing protein [Planctomycetes bacterium]|nr:carboxypeptidase regulatory-like domain-containing protein [Planctomycetota bacterium]